jgi:hypothetical protein
VNKKLAVLAHFAKMKIWKRPNYRKMPEGFSKNLPYFTSWFLLLERLFIGCELFSTYVPGTAASRQLSSL